MMNVVSAIVILDDKGAKVYGKYMSSEFAASTKKQVEFEREIFKKTARLVTARQDG